MNQQSKRVVAVALSDGLFDELNLASSACRCSPAEFASEAVECVLASRRLRRIKPVIETPEEPTDNEDLEFDHD
jgi:hypothetical protein